MKYRWQKTKPVAQCNLCKRDIFDNVDPSRIITCARCVQILLMATRENKIAFRNSLLEKGDLEGSRSVESFILDKEGSEIATFKKRLPRRTLRPFYRRLKRL